MKVKTTFERPVKVIGHTWIPMSDGTRLSARIWLPQDAEQRPVPAIVEYIPYRKNDWFAMSDSMRHPYFAGHGYAAVRVDLRGSGDSEGLLLDEYLAQEQQDAVEVIAWLGRQSWCTGAVGMIGFSWGGFAALQVAARRPPELRAIIPLHFTDDRYADDVHYMGGCVLGFEMLAWASTMLAYNARPPDPEVVGDRWEEIWRERMERTPPYIDAWLSHQRRDDYWKHGSVCENYAAIDCAVYAIGGWADAYTNAVPRLLRGLTCPKKALIGPWAHNYPDAITPGPQIGFLQEALRWWDQWLKGQDTGIMDEPMLRVWMPEAVAPQPDLAEWPGRWVAEPGWPSPTVRLRALHLGDGMLESEPQPEFTLELVGAQAAGLEAGVWCPHGLPVDLPPDQRREDGLALSFTSAPLTERVELLGFPEAHLTLSADRPLALVAARLCDVAPTGSSTLITRGLLNLAHRDGHEHPAALEPGRPYTITVRLNAIAYALPAGHRIRLTVSPTYWPWAWPSPEPVKLTVITGARSRLELPVRPSRSEDFALASFAEPEFAEPVEVEVLSTTPCDYVVRHDVATGCHEIDLSMGTVMDERGGYRRLVESGLEFEELNTNCITIVEGDPLSARVECDWTCKLGRAGWQTRIETHSVMTSDHDLFHVTNALDGYRGDTRIFAKTWTHTIPRDHV
jgi:putative CocE/NonD family hydrolase